MVLLSLSGLLFALFVLNVLVGSFQGPHMLSDLGKIFLLFVASTLFIIATLQREGKNKY